MSLLARKTAGSLDTVINILDASKKKIDVPDLPALKISNEKSLVFAEVESEPKEQKSKE